jgi:valyl-tRNA synthetase
MDAADLKRFFPNDIRETGYDILFFWVARETMLALALLGKAPYSDVYLHGLIRNEYGQKISKSMPDAWKYDPLYLIDEYGTDALRYTLATSSTPGNDMNLDSRRMEGARNFANKLWQASRFILMNLGEDELRPAAAALSDQGLLALEDRWILSRIQHLTDEVFHLMEEFQYGEAGRRIRDFLWDEFCDWYIEATKVRLYDENADKATPRTVLLTVLEQSLRLLHPFMPFVTEALWQALPASFRQGPALIVALWPEADASRYDAQAEAQMALMMELIRGIRNARAEYGVPAGKRIPAVVAAGAARAGLDERRALLESLARLDGSALTITNTCEPVAQSAAVVVGDVVAYLPLAGMVDLEAERERIRKALSGLEGRIESSAARLAGPFAQKAPVAVVARERETLAAMEAEAAQLREQLARLA